MMILKARAILPIVLGAALLVTGCNKLGLSSPKTPTGQVVATVGSREITQRELQVEMAGSTASTPAAQKAEQALALRRIIQRVILASAAKDQGLDKGPNFALLSQRANETLLAQLLESKTAASVPAPTKEEVQQFQETNPNLFAERKIFDVDQIRISQPSDPQLAKKLEPFKTMDQIASYLNQNHIAFQRGSNVMDAATQNPKLLAAIMKLPPQEVFILSSTNEIFVNEIVNTRVEPLVGDAAAKYAQNVLKSQHVQDAVVRQMTNIVNRASSSVRLAKEFQPPAKPPAAKQQP